MFENATKLDATFLENHFTYRLSLSPALQKNKFDDCYIDICGLVARCCYLEPTPSQIEEYISTGKFKYKTVTVECPINTVEERKFLFLAAQAKQLIYDMVNGRGAMFRGEDKRFNVCEDTLMRVKMLGLYMPTFCTG